MALAAAEEACEFEHRDLHWGNVMLRPAESFEASYSLRCGRQIQGQAEGMVRSR